MTTTYLSITNTPPRTQAPKRLSLGDNAPDGNLTMYLSGGWSEYKPEEVETIIAAMQTWLKALRPWDCRFCQETNFTTPHGQYGYKFARCRHCKKKTPLDKFKFADEAS